MAHIAPLVAGWQRRLGGQAGPLGPVSAGSGDSPNGADLQVELLIDGLWVDITSYVMTRTGDGSVSITRGIPNERSQTEPSTCRFQLNNRDGRFSPRNPVSPYYGKIGRNTQLRVSVPNGNDKSYRFWGEVSEWPQRWDTTGTDVWVDLQAAGILRRLGQGASSLRSPVFRQLMSPMNPYRQSIVAYWPCEDATGSTSIASGLVGGPAMTVIGSTQLASYDGFPGSDPLPILSTSSFTCAVPTYTATGTTAIRALMFIPEAGLPFERPLLSFSTSGTAWAWILSVTTTGQVRINAYANGGATILNQLVAFALNGTNSIFVVTLTASGANTDWLIAATNIDTGVTTQFSGTLASYTAPIVTLLNMPHEQNATGVSMGHVAIATDSNAYADTLSSIRGWAGETPQARMARLCDEEGIDYATVDDGQTGSQTTMGAQGSEALLTLIEECIQVDSGFLTELSTGLGLGNRARVSLYNQAPVLALSYPSGQLAGQLVPVDDDQTTRNDVTATRRKGSSYRVTQDSGPLSTLPPPAGVGRYDESATVNAELDTQLPWHAGWRVHLGTVDEARYPTVSVNLAHPTFTASSTLRAQVLNVRPGDRITISGVPAWLPPDDISQLVLGFSETITGFEHRITWNCAPESAYRVAVLDSSSVGRLDSGGAVLAADVSATATTFSVSTTSGPVWTTSDLPLDVRIGGEKVTVTAVSGAVSPQSATVTRSVNGVVKAQLAGTDIRLDQPANLGL
jgi:hypothetical protein